MIQYLSIDICFVLVHCYVGMLMASCLWGASPILGRNRITLLQPNHQKTATNKQNERPIMHLSTSDLRGRVEAITHELVRVYFSCFLVSLNSIQRFLRSRKCASLRRRQRRQTDYGRSAMTILTWAFGPGATLFTHIIDRTSNKLISPLKKKSCCDNTFVATQNVVTLQNVVITTFCLALALASIGKM